MPLDLDNNQAKYQIRAYQPGAIVVNELKLTHSIIVGPDQLIDNWRPQSVADLQVSDFDIIINAKPAILLIGTGAQQIFIDTTLYGNLINLGIGVELMDTSAACRTFNALTAENRHVMAALLIR